MVDEDTSRTEPEGLSRRGFGKAAGVSVMSLAGIGGYALLGRGTRPALALEAPNSFVANGASIETTDRSVDSIMFGDVEDLDERDFGDGTVGFGHRSRAGTGGRGAVHTSCWGIPLVE
jgi:hypothetical protein